MNSLLHDNLSGVRQIKAYVRERQEHIRFNEMSNAIETGNPGGDEGLGALFAGDGFSDLMRPGHRHRLRRDGCSARPDGDR